MTTATLDRQALTYPKDAIRYVPEHFLPLFEPDPSMRTQFYVLEGGRSSGKTETVGLAIPCRVRELERLSGRPVRVMCLRETQKSLRQSSKAIIDGALTNLGKEWKTAFPSDNAKIRTPLGGEIFFEGMSETYRTDESVLSIARVDIVWWEQGEAMSHRSRELLYPSIFRFPGAEIWVTFNPRHRHDPVYRDFIAPGARKGTATVMHGNYADLPAQWKTAEQESERQACLQDEPARYPHVWEGKTDDGSETKIVLPFEMLQVCVDMWERGKEQQGTIHAGLDVADTGADRNALVARRGPCITHAQRWSEPTLGATTRTADAWCKENGAVALHYDAGGIGGGVRSHFSDMYPVRGQRPFALRGENFGGAVQGKDLPYDSKQTNGDFFQRRNSQMAWAVRQRAQRTIRLRDGEDINPATCLFINPNTPRLEEYLAQLAQPQYDQNNAGRLVIDKEPDDAPSPDLYDATILAFARDSRDGLKAR